MIRKSSFAILHEELSYRRTWIFSSITQKIYHFSYQWGSILNEVTKNDDLCQKLVKLGVLTQDPDYFEEIKRYLKTKEVEARKRMYICFTVTTNCNYRCSYCFQNHVDCQDTTLDVIEKFGNLLGRKLDSHKEIQEVTVTLFGGEPLVRLDLCLHLMMMIRNTCETRNIKCGIFMTTNGVDADSGKLDLLKTAGLKGVQITFDGSMELHNKIRDNLISNRNAYTTTLINLPEFAKRFSVWIKYNLNKQNIDCFEEFIMDLKKLDLIFPMKIEALHSTLTDTDPTFYFSSNDPHLAEAYLKLAFIAQENKIPFDISSSLQPPCMVSSDNSFMIEPDGSVSMCISAYNMRKLNLGNIFRISSLDFDRNSINTWILEAAKKLCIKKRCSFFPICETGCFFTKMLQGIKFEEPYCRESFYSVLVPGLIQLEMKKRVEMIK